ncbi:MAG: HNH endonuclease [Coriobacteriales bacterium]|nr:HNH endonuclease [Coriobacteriales bacterium]
MRKNWTEEETMMAFALYFILPSGSWDKKNPDIIALANHISRTPDAVVFKLGNISSFDKNRIGQGLVGLKNASRLDKEIWEWYAERGDDLIDEATTRLKNAFMDKPSWGSITYAFLSIPEGTDKDVSKAQRVNQQYFRNTLLKNYDAKCCMTGLDIDSLLIASHIKPWSVSDPRTERLAPSNGLLLNALHDRAFDKGLITIDRQYRIRVSPKLKESEINREWLLRFNGESIQIPDIYPPALGFIEYHNDMVFRR